jgi:hypothetical protein
MISTDNQVETALGLFDEAKEIANLKWKTFSYVR